jgi:hypothetical protein
LSPENKTKENSGSVHDFLNEIEDKQKREDAFELLGMMKKISGREPKLWGSTIIGFGKIHYQYTSGHSGDTCICGFSPRKEQFSVYLTYSDIDSYKSLLDKLGRHKTGKSCLYIKRLADIDKKVLESMI